MLESYISPFLLGYVNKYIKNLKPEDLQLSLWGGDLVLNKLDLRLDVLEHELNLPLTFISGHIHELRIHVPWTRLGYEPVVVTINTIECALKLRDAGYDEHDSASSKSSVQSKSKPDSTSQAKLKYEKQDRDLPPGYVQSLMNRVINNVTLVIKNLVLKYVEEDIVLSVNVKSAESFAVNANWLAAFTELSLPELVLRRVCEFSDLTVCLDKRNASGKIEVYQEPVAYRCAVTLRMHMTYTSLNAKRPSIIKINVNCNELDMSLSDTQLPMFIRLLQLLMALYYGTLDQGSKVVESGDQIVVTETGKTETKTESSKMEGPAMDSEGWASWAWSYVPDILYYEDEEEGSTRKRETRPDPILSVGLYCDRARITFKLSKEISTDHPVYSTPSPKLKTYPLLRMELSGSAIEVLMRGELFFVHQMGFSHITASVMGDCVCGLAEDGDGVSPRLLDQDTPFLQCGSPDYSHKYTNYLTNSLFDVSCPENKQQRASFILDWDQHQDTYSEALATQRFGAVWTDYLFVAERMGNRNASDSSSRSSHHSADDSDPIFDMKEMSCKQFLFSPAKLVIGCAIIHRLQKFHQCAVDHEYEPYSTPRPEIVDEKRLSATPDQISTLEEWVPSRSSHVTLLNLQVLFSSAQHPYYGSAKRKETRQDTTIPDAGPVPTLCLQIDRVDIQITEPMYPRKLIKPISKLLPSDRSSKLMHHCYTHKYYKIFGCQFGLTYVDPRSDLSPPVLPIMPSWSAAVYHKVLVLPVYWNERNLVHSEMMLELPGLSWNATKAQCLLMMHIYNTWSSKQPQTVVSRLAGTSLMDDVFKPSVKAFPSGQPVLQASIHSLEVRLSQTHAVQAISGTLSQAQLIMQALDQGRASDTPLFHGPVDTTNLHQYKSLMKQQLGVSQIDTVDLLTFTLQIPRMSDLEKTVGESCGVFLLDIQGTALCVDPLIYTWLLYQPRGQVRSKVIEEASSRRSKSSVTKHNSSQGSSSAHKMKTNVQDNTMKASLPLQRQTSSLTQQDREPAGYQPHGSDSKTEDNKSKNEEGNLLEKLWVVLKHLTVQVDIQSCFVALPTDHLNFAPDVTSIPQCIRQSMLGRGGGEMVVLSLPTLKAQSLSHQKVLALQEIPLERKDLPPDPGEKLPWSIKASNLSMYTIHADQGAYYLLKPLVLSATVGVTSSFGHGASQSPTLGLCVHADMQEIMMACSKPQVALCVKLLNQALRNQSKLIEVFRHEQRPHPTQATHIPPNQQSPSKMAPKVLSSVASSGQLENQDVVTTLSASSPTDAAGVAPPDKDAGNNDALKLSLWLQWTLQKCCVSLYGGAPPMKISCEVEDLTTSLDLQGVYSKVTCKVGSININHYTKREESWGRGPFRGVLFSCNDTITHNTRILGLQPNNQSAPRPFNPFAVTHAAKPGDSKSHGFLSATWTRAQGQSVAQKMSSKQAETSKKADAETTPSTPRFIHEIVVSVQPFDIVVWCPLIVSMLDIFKTDSIVHARSLDSSDNPESQVKPRLARLQSQQTLSTASALSPSDSYPRSSTASQKSTSPGRREWLSSRSLPLVYLDCKEIRVFAPTSEPSFVNKEEVTGIEMDEDESDVTMVTQDTFLLQVNSVCLVPHADNPLQRLVLKKEIFRRAVQAGQTQTPGSEVEDRQYQLDINNLSMSVALWEQIEAGCDRGKVGVNGVGVQNPALEWNTEQLSPAPKEVRLLPIVVGIDMRFVAAPAIVIDKSYGGLDKKKSTPVMVCGHSLEMDFTSDMTFYLSTGQVCLLQTLAQENFLSLMKLAPLHSAKSSAGDTEHASRRTPALQTGKPTAQSHDKHAGTHHQTITRSAMKKPTQLEDSGLGSEDSTQVGGVKVQKLKVKMQEIPMPKVEPSSAQGQKSKKVSKSSGFMPVDALITAGKVSLFLYSRQMLVAKNMRTEQREEPSCRLETIKEESVELQPFLFVTAMQPAAVLSLGHQQQRAQVTIYDFTIDGASSKHAAQDIPISQLLPSPGDYTVSWFETCPGEPDPKTGVRPALLTFAVTDCLSNHAVAKLNIGRPIKVSLSLSKVDQALDFIKALIPPKSTQISTVRIAQCEAAPPGGAVVIPILPRQLPTRKTKPSVSQSGHRDALEVLTRVRSVSVQMTEFVVAMATVPDSDYPHVVCSFSECQGALDLQNDDGIISEIQARLAFQQLLMKTSICRKTRPLIGPVNLVLTANSQWAAPGGHQALGTSSVKRMTAGVNLGHVTVFLGQEHLNCLSLMQRRVEEYMDKYKQTETRGESSKRRSSSHQRPLSVLLAPSGTVISQQPDRHYKDDLRAGTFHYVTDSDGIGLQPKANEIVFSSPTLEHDVKGHWGSMTWSYPEPRILTHVSVTPIPLHQAGVAESDVTAEEEVPCTLEYWDDLRQGFCIYKQLYVSEVHSYHLTLPSADDKACRQAVSSLWRVVLNSVVQNSDDEPLSRKNHPGLIVSPTALAASMRVDSCFSAHLLPALSLGFKMECMEVRLAHHTDALGKGQPKWLEHFVLDGLSPADQEMMVLRLKSLDMYINHWSATQANTNVQMSTSIQCDLMTYRNLTMSTLLHPVGVTATLDSTWGQGVEGHVDLGSVKVSVGQQTVHTLNMALQAMKQANEVDKERLLFCSYAICNDTDGTLRFGQVHTDESVVLASRKVHEYSWRTHKHHRQRLHVCIEGWRNWRWSEPFSLDQEGTIVRTLQHQEQTATLFIKIKKISGLQKQVIFCGQHIFTNMLSLDLEVQFIRLARIGSQVIDTKHFQNLPANSSLPSLTCSSNDITGVRLRLDKDGCDWSEQFAISGEMSREQSILKICNQDGVFHYMWCRLITEEIQGNVQRLVLLSPLFIMRSHLPWPLTMNIELGKQHDQKAIEVRGQATDQSLYQFAPDAWHNLTFRLSQEAEISSPSIPINTDMIDELDLGSASDLDDTSPVSIETVAKCCQPLDMTKAWPYNHLDYNSAKSFTGSLRHTELPPSKQSLPDGPLQETPSGSVHQPHTDLQVSITQPCRFLNTIMVDVLPWCLIVNETDLDIDVLEHGCQPVCVQKGQVTAPQRFKKAFHLQLSKVKYTTSNKSNPIHLIAASVPSTGHDPSTLTLISEGFIQICLSVQRMGLAQNRVARLTVRSTVRHNIRIITILPQFILRNKCKRSVRMRTLDVTSTNKLPLQDSSLHEVTVPSATSQETHIPITQWNVPPTGQPITTEEESMSQYFSLASELTNQSAGIKETANREQTHWSRWVLVDISRPRLPVAVPIHQVYSQASPKATSDMVTMATQPLVAILADQEGVTYLTLDDDSMTRVTISNSCPYPLHFGQTPFDVTEKLEVLEQQSPVPSIPLVLPHCLVHYDLQRPPTSSTSDSEPRPFLPSIHLCLGSFLGVAICLEDSQGEQRVPKEERKGKYSWSDAIQLATDHQERSEIVSVAGVGYVLLSSFFVGTQLQVRIDPLSMDVSKTSGRSGIQPSTEPPGNSVPNSLLAVEMGDTHQEISARPLEKNTAHVNPLQYRFRLSAGSVVVMLMDEVTDLVQTSEMLRVTIDDVQLLSFPCVEDGTKSPVQQQKLQVSVQACQVDNQLFKVAGSHDFAVILCSQPDNLKSGEDEVPPDAPVENLAIFYSKHHSFVALTLLESCSTGSFKLATVEVEAKPLELYIEDKLMSDLLVKIQTFLPAKSQDEHKPIKRQSFPTKVQVASCALKDPISLRQLLIQPVRLLASIHASLKLFIAVDSTPLSFKQFDSGPVFATTRQLVQALTVHYTSGALFKAGWVLGSLEILGNPAGLLRNVRSGLTDSVLLPYEGLTRGPAAFVAGVTSGTSSLLKHLSAGTLTSITMFASSVSRNLDRLTLDEDHIARREKQRRRVPDRVTDGLLQGLSGFGISLLGAIGGIADQPIKSFYQAPAVSSPTQKATGVIRGVGKGLMGVVIKPLGGAAELVSQTGQGILHSAGLVETRTPRGECVTLLSAMAENSRLKYTWKMLQSLPNSDILIHCNITTITFHGLQRGGCLLLTPEVLFVVSSSEDTQQQVFPIFELECTPVAGSKEGVCVNVKSPMSPSVLKKEETSSRVADFVGGIASRPCDPLDIDPLVSSDTQSDGSSLPGVHTVDDTRGTTSYQYFFQQACYRDTFLSLFQQAKNKLLGKGFCYDETNNTGFSRFKMWHTSTKMQLEGL